MRRFPTGVTLLTVRDGDRIHGMTANSFTSVSLSPTLVLICVNQKNTTHQFITRAGNFAINMLSARQPAIAQRFARQSAQPIDPFADMAYHLAATGAPIIDDCIAYVDCRVTAAYPAGDHTIFIGEVLHAGFGNARDDQPLIWLDGAYTSLNADQSHALWMPTPIV